MRMSDEDVLGVLSDSNSKIKFKPQTSGNIYEIKKGRVYIKLSLPFTDILSWECPCGKEFSNIDEYIKHTKKHLGGT